MPRDIGSLNEFHFDILKEVGNIGVGNAVASLSMLISKQVRMTVPVVKFLEFKDVGSILGGDEEQVFGILVHLSGEISGMMMFLVKPVSAMKLVNGLMGGLCSDPDDWSEIALSALQEIGNILCSSYLGALSGFTHKSVIPTPPILARDMAAAILSVPAIEFGKMSDGVLFIDTVFETDGENASGFFLLVPDMPSFTTILTSLGIQAEGP